MALLFRVFGSYWLLGAGSDRSGADRTSFGERGVSNQLRADKQSAPRFPLNFRLMREEE